MRMVRRVMKWTGILVASIVALLLVVLVILPPATRPFTDRWGATDAEVAAKLPGDELVTEPDQASTRAISIEAPPELVFALVKQMGYGRGGWYAWDWFYQATGSADFVDGHHSRRIDPRLQDFGVHDSIEILPEAALEAVVFEAPRAMVLYKCTDEKNELIEPGMKKPEVYSDMSWAWIVEPDGDGGSRLILRTRASDAGQPPLVRWIYDDPLEMGGAVFGYKTLYGIKRTAAKLVAVGVAVDASGTQVAGPEMGLDAGL